MIYSLADAQERVRLILDRADSPWLTNTELNGFIELAINEFTRERINNFGSNQKLRDDFGQYVKTAIFGSSVDDSDTDDFQVYSRQFAGWTEAGAFDTNLDMEYEYPGGEWGINENGTGCDISDINFGTLLEIKVIQGGTGKRCKIMSIDDALVAQNDPFNQSGAVSSYHGVRVGDYYWVIPGITNPSHQVALTFVSNRNEAGLIMWLPLHAREEVCQIAARKIMGTTADERVAVTDSEIKQLEGK